MHLAPKSSFLLIGVALLALAAALSRAENAPRKEASAGATRFFLDWSNVFSGRLEPSFDPARISPEGFAIIERDRKEWGIEQDLSGHGMKRNRMPQGVRISIEKARKSGAWLRADQPWEKQLAWVTVIHEGGKYRCWYWVYNDTLAPGVEELLCYAESTDGTRWVKPDLGVHSFPAAPKNNIVSLWNHESVVFRDDTAPTAERYKSFVWDKLPPDASAPTGAPRYGLFGAVSPDGYRWTRWPEPLLPYFHDTQNVVYWDEEKRKYVAYLRGSLSGRAISYAETEDFRRWPSTRAEVIAHPGALDAPSDDYYTNGFTRYPGEPTIRLLFPTIYHHATDLADVRLGVTHNGRTINWVSYDPIVEPGRPGEWDAGGVYTGANLVRLPNGTLALPYRGMSYSHNEWYFGQLYKDTMDERGNKRTTSLGWAIWDDGRLAGVEAEREGEFWSRPEQIESAQIRINARVANGGILEIELWEPVSRRVSRPIPGFTFGECVALRGDERWSLARWQGQNDLGELKGKTVQLRVRLRAAKIFGYRFVN